MKRVSIIINNHNYGVFLEDAILSALNQGYPNIEVIVVDDGSEDDSRNIIEQYNQKVIPVLKECGGQASALNAGFKKSRGEIIMFLDSDDRLLPSAAEQVVKAMETPDIAKVHWPMWIINENGIRTGKKHPNLSSLPAGDFREEVMEKGPANLHSSPTSGNAWARNFLIDVGPIPEDIYRICADTHLIQIAPFWGILAAISEPIAEYRIHGKNAYAGTTLEFQLASILNYYEKYATWLVAYCHHKGQQVSVETWKKNSWHHQQAEVITEVAALPARSGSLILVDDNLWQPGPIAGWKRLPFLEQNGLFAGFPQNNEHAIQEVERLRSSGSQYIVFWSHSFWWFEAYAGFYEYLNMHYDKVINEDRIVGFDLCSKN